MQLLFKSDKCDFIYIKSYRVLVCLRNLLRTRYYPDPDPHSFLKLDPHSLKKLDPDGPHKVDAECDLKSFRSADAIMLLLLWLDSELCRLSVPI
jgi:hypothetical protein